MPKINSATEKRRMPIRRRVLLSVLITTVAALVGAIIASVICMQMIRDNSERELTTQLEHNLRSTVVAKAEETEAKLEHYEKYIEFITDYIDEMYQGRQILVDMGTYIDAPRITTPEGEYSMQGTLATEDISIDDVMDDVKFFSNLEKVWSPIARENEGQINTIYIGAESGFMVAYDKDAHQNAVPAGEYIYYDYLQSEWYQEGVKTDEIYYTAPYMDSFGRGLTITIGKSFYDTDGVVQGMDCIDFNISGLYNEMIAMDIGEGASYYAINKDGMMITPDSEDSVRAESFTGLTHADIKDMLSEKSGVFQKGGKFYAFVKLDRVDWTLCASVPRDLVLQSVNDMDRTIGITITVFILVALIIIAVVAVIAIRVARSITQPMEMLKDDMAIISAGDIDYKSRPIRNDEIGDMSTHLNKMVQNLKSTLTVLADTQQKAEEMSELANKDALTGVKNKTAYDKEVKKIEWEMVGGETKFGVVMIDLNYLKKINDTFGHDKGDIAITNLCEIVCDTFEHSPVYRIGGDEFAVIVKGRDYERVEKLTASFKEKTAIKQDEDEPWMSISAAIGYALYDKDIDSSVDNVFKRADKAMYECKTAMKGGRE